MNAPRTVSFGRRLTELAQSRPDATVITLALQDGGEDAISYAGLERWSNRAARLLAAKGVDAGTMVCIGLYNSLEHYAVAYAAWKLGACTLPLSPRMPDLEFRGITGLVAHKLVVADRPNSSGNDADLAKADIAALRDGGPYADTALPDITAHPGKAIGSGGSTGRSKIIVDPRPWSRAVGEMLLGAGVGMRPGQVQLVAGPLYHNSPFSWSHYGIFDEHHIVVMERFDAARAMDLIERHRVQFGFLAPTMMQRIVRLPGIEARDFSSVEIHLRHRGTLSALAEAPLDRTDRTRENHRGFRLQRGCRRVPYPRRRMAAPPGQRGKAVRQRIENPRRGIPRGAAGGSGRNLLPPSLAPRAHLPLHRLPAGEDHARRLHQRG